MVNYSHRKMKEEEERQIITVDAFQVAEKRNQDMKAKLIEVEREREKKKSAAAAMDNVERQAKGQQVLLRNVED